VIRSVCHWWGSESGYCTRLPHPTTSAFFHLASTRRTCLFDDRGSNFLLCHHLLLDLTPATNDGVKGNYCPYQWLPNRQFGFIQLPAATPHRNSAASCCRTQLLYIQAQINQLQNSHHIYGCSASGLDICGPIWKSVVRACQSARPWKRFQMFNVLLIPPTHFVVPDDYPTLSSWASLPQPLYRLIGDTNTYHHKVAGGDGSMVVLVVYHQRHDGGRHYAE
jgi:hypothetical protein